MRAILFSDFHAHSWAAYSKHIEWSGRLINSRLLDHVRVLDQVEKYCLDNDINVVLFCGDLFHESQRVGTIVFNTIFRRVGLMIKRGLKIFMLPGNHDLVGTDTNSDNSLVPFKTLGCVVMDTPGIYEVIDSFSIYACPYRQKESSVLDIVGGLVKERKPEMNDILMLHQGINGAVTGPSDYVIQYGLEASDLMDDFFMHVFLGHYHTAQTLKKDVEYVGSALQHRWDDAGQIKSFIDYDVDSGLFKRISTTAPRFIKLLQEEMDAFDFESHCDDFIKVLYTDLTKDDRKAIRSTYPTVSIEFVPAPIKSDNDTGVDVSLSMTHSEVIERYVKSGFQPLQGLKKEDVISAGNYLVRGERWPVEYGRIKADAKII